MDPTEGMLCFPPAFIISVPEFSYLLRSTVEFHSFFSLSLSPASSFRRVQVRVQSSEMCWLVYKGSDIKMDQEILVPLSTLFLPSHGSKYHTSTP